VLVMVAVSVGTTFFIIPRVDRIRRDTPGPIAALVDTDTRKIEFNRLHGLSNALVLLTLLGGLGLIWFETNDTH